jgi:hypothetical protein
MQNQTLHPECIARYRASTTGLCPTEVNAMRARRADPPIFGGSAMRAIVRTCSDRTCRAEHHWCVTCRVAPRCSCLLPHTSATADATGHLHWAPSQSHFIEQLGVRICDDRYGGLVALLVAAAEPSAAPAASVTPAFCATCSLRIFDGAEGILRARGRSYRELLHNMLPYIPSLLCGPCADMCTRVPCLEAGASCPSAGIPLTLREVIEYTPHSRGRRTVTDRARGPSIGRVARLLCRPHDLGMLFAGLGINARPRIRL